MALWGSQVSKEEGVHSRCVPSPPAGSQNSAEGQLREGEELVGDAGGPRGRAIREAWAQGRGARALTVGQWFDVRISLLV